VDEQSGPEAQSPQSPPPPGPDVQLERKGGARMGSWAIGVIVIVIGIIFLAKNLGWTGPDWAFDNWWALFILIPAFGSFAGAWRSYSTNGRRLNSDVARTLMIGLVLLAVTIIFLLELNWGKVWPVLLVIVGLGLLLGWKRN
jgi:hypothetical protein